MIIDCHAHYASDMVLPPTFFDGWEDNLLAQVPRAERDQHSTRLKAMLRRLRHDPGCDRLVAEMDEAGIDKAVLLAIDFGFALPDDFPPLGDVLALHTKVLSRHPGRLMAFAGIDPRRGADGVRLFDAAARDLSFQGLKLYPPCGYSPSDPSLDALFEICAARRIPVLTHVGPTSPRLSFEYSEPALIDRAARRFPGVKFILAHAAVTHHESAALLAEYRPNVYLEVSGFQTDLRRGLLGDIVRFHRARGLFRKMIFGTDWPIHRMFGRQADWVDALRPGPEPHRLTAEEFDLLTHHNPIEILGMS